MKFLWTTILVNNMDESLKFYEEIVGLKMTERFQAGPGMEISFLGEGETKVELIYNEKFKKLDAGNRVTLGFKVESLDEKINFIKEKGIKIITGPIEPNPSIKYFIIKDPDGVKIQFAQQLQSN
ncbi:MAG TPA: VOC family protein [Sedimentibacter sp.]|jgi:lactoylglutathione lyase|nr:VOC family protein [Sedimentibacter sp.]NLA13194.1 VOC family protein [Tissierellia bacterium]HOA19191.1 VOC family protein [Sedimentibacter sp.]HOG61972.1 VOC family protein [Sedimentibacter sp.]HOT22544.1 VOC family protein [Sedimentibacter sp.]